MRPKTLMVITFLQIMTKNKAKLFTLKSSARGLFFADGVLLSDSFSFPEGDEHIVIDFNGFTEISSHTTSSLSGAVWGRAASWAMLSCCDTLAASRCLHRLQFPSAVVISVRSTGTTPPMEPWVKTNIQVPRQNGRDKDGRPQGRNSTVRNPCISVQTMAQKIDSRILLQLNLFYLPSHDDIFRKKEQRSW